MAHGKTEFAVEAAAQIVGQVRAEHENIQAAQISAIGAFQHAVFAWFDEERKAFRNVPIDRQVEACSVLGYIGLVAGKPAVHVHGVVALPTGETRGGHMLEAYVFISPFVIAGSAGWHFANIAT